MLTTENRELLLEKLKGHYSEVGATVKPKRVKADFVYRVLKGTKKSPAVDKAAVEFGEKLDREAADLNNRAQRLHSII